MVRGAALMVTATAGTYQCADMARIALGRGRCSPIRRHAAVQALWLIAFMGLPWPRNKAGRGFAMTIFRAGGCRGMRLQTTGRRRDALPLSAHYKDGRGSPRSGQARSARPPG